MFIIDAQCKECGFIPEEGMVFTSYEGFRIQETNQVIRCPKCQGHMFRIFRKVPVMIVKEGNRPESSKSSSYFRNAEEVKQKNIRKRMQEQEEKDFYNRK